MSSSPVPSAASSSASQVGPEDTAARGADVAPAEDSTPAASTGPAAAGHGARKPSLKERGGLVGILRRRRRR